MDIRELRIGDKVVDRASGFVFVVCGLFAPDCVQAVPDVPDYEGDVWEFATHELEPRAEQSKEMSAMVEHNNRRN